MATHNAKKRLEQKTVFSISRQHVENIFRVLTYGLNFLPLGQVPGDDSIPIVDAREQIINVVKDAIDVSHQRFSDSDNAHKVCSSIYESILLALEKKQESRDTISIITDALISLMSCTLRASEQVGLLTLYRNPSLKNWNLFVTVNGLVPEFKR